MKRGIWSPATLATTLCLLSAPAAAQQPGFADNGRIVIGAERLTGLFFEHVDIVQTTTIPDGMGGTVTSEDEIKARTTTFAFLGTSTGPPTAEVTTAGGTSTVPRLAIDVFVASGFSVGGAITYVHAEGTLETTDDGDSEGEEDQPVFNGLMFAPRVGYAIPLSPKFAIWPRAGLTHTVYWASEEDDDGPETVETSQTLQFTDLTLEGMVAVTPVPNVAIVFGPFLDLGLTGSVSTETTPDQTPSGFESETDWKYTSFGITGGIALVF